MPGVAAGGAGGDGERGEIVGLGGDGAGAGQRAGEVAECLLDLLFAGGAVTGEIQGCSPPHRFGCAVDTDQVQARTRAEGVCDHSAQIPVETGRGRVGASGGGQRE